MGGRNGTHWLLGRMSARVKNDKTTLIKPLINLSEMLNSENNSINMLAGCSKIYINFIFLFVTKKGKLLIYFIQFHTYVTLGSFVYLKWGK